MARKTPKRMPSTQTITDLNPLSPRLAARGHGVIEVANGQLVSVTPRWLPKRVSLAEALLWGRAAHARRAGDRCWLYYNQPRRCPNYLALKYIVSHRGASFATFRLAALVLDRIAEIKRADAIVTEVTNLRISARLLRRWGWEPHLENGWRRHYIKRFYGHYPRPAPALGASLLAVAAD